MKDFIRFLLFGNYFYGICAIGLSIESSLQQHSTLNSFPYYLLLFSGTVLYYTYAYVAEPDGGFSNKRSIWYRQYKKQVSKSQFFFAFLFLCLFIYLLYTYRLSLQKAPLFVYLFLLIFPLVALFYYGTETGKGITHNLRKKGWLKPLVIGFVWAGIVTIYPIIFHSIENQTVYSLQLIGILLFIKNFMYITVLSIMFDIKDYAADHNQMLKTFVVRFGLRKTIFYILIPLSLIGLGTFILYAILQDFPLARIFINTFPFILLIIVAYSMYRRKSILYYLAIIDGLMLVKAACGIIGISLIK